MRDLLEKPFALSRQRAAARSTQMFDKQSELTIHVSSTNLSSSFYESAKANNFTSLL